MNPIQPHTQYHPQEVSTLHTRPPVINETYSDTSLRSILTTEGRVQPSPSLDFYDTHSTSKPFTIRPEQGAHRTIRQELSDLGLL